MNKSTMRKMYEAKGEGEKFREMRNASRKRNYAQTAKYERRIWTDEEDKRVLVHNISDRQLSREIRRSVYVKFYIKFKNHFILLTIE